MAQVFSTDKMKVFLPAEILDGIVEKTMTTSTIAKLSAREPMKFGPNEIVVFNDLPKAEIVTEGAKKHGTSAGFTSVRAKQSKAQVTVRVSDEVLWAGEDRQVAALQKVGDAASVALSRALDLYMYHAINPLTGQVEASADGYIGKTSKTVDAATGEADAQFRAAVKAIQTGDDRSLVTGAALDPEFAFALADLQGKLANGDPNGQARYPSLGFGTNVNDFLGLPVAVGDTVSGRPEASKDTGVRAVVGDFANGLRWGIQRQLPLTVIPYGDPDNTGDDLAGSNQIALRLEIVWGWYAFVDKFAVIKNGTPG